MRIPGTFSIIAHFFFLFYEATFVATTSAENGLQLPKQDHQNDHQKQGEERLRKQPSYTKTFGKYAHLCVDSSDDAGRCGSFYRWSVEDRDFVSLFNGVPITRLPDCNVSLVRGKIIRVAVDNMKPYIMSSSNSNIISGYLGEMWKITEEFLQFESRILPAMSYEEAAGLVENSSADVTLAVIVFLRHIKNAEFSQPYFTNWHYLYFKRPESIASSSSYLRTLSGSLWLASVGLFLSITTTLSCSIKLLNYATNRGRRNLYYYEKRVEPSVSVPSCLLASCCGFLNQGYDLKLKTYSCRIQLILALLFGYLLYGAMSAVLVSQLALAEFKMPVASVEDVPKGQRAMCIRTNSFAYENFTDGDKRILPRWKSTVNTKGCLDTNEIANIPKLICKDDILILENRVIMSTVMEDFPIGCKIAHLPEKYFRKGNAFVYLKSFREKYIISTFLKRLRSVGVAQKLENKWISKSESENARTEAPQITFYHITGILSAYSVMVIVSLCILIVERVVYRYSQQEQEEEMTALPFVN